jgi:haloacetate dehalogenase
MLHLRCFRKPSVIRATCEDYRAGLSVDLGHDRADRTAGRRSTSYEPLAIWRQWADTVEGFPLDCGHFVMEEAPEAVTAALVPFFKPDVS